MDKLAVIFLGISISWGIQAAVKGMSAEELLKMSKLPPELKAKSDQNRMKLVGSCTDKNGRVFQHYDKGYDQCLASRSDLKSEQEKEVGISIE